MGFCSIELLFNVLDDLSRYSLVNYGREYDDRPSKFWCITHYLQPNITNTMNKNQILYPYHL